ncbi:MAG: hypothetical protein ABI538_05835 [Pseudoxanthomonas sp.]
MNKPAKILAWVAGPFLALLLVVEVADRFFIGSMCANDILAEVPSPDGAYKAIMFQRDCGATTGFSTQVSVLRSSRALGDDADNAFVADTDHGAAPSAPGGGPEVGIRWLSPTSLAIPRHRLARVYVAEPHVGGINVAYGPMTE